MKIYNLKNTLTNVYTLTHHVCNLMVYTDQTQTDKIEYIGKNGFIFYQNDPICLINSYFGKSNFEFIREDNE